MTYNIGDLRIHDDGTIHSSRNKSGSKAGVSEIYRSANGLVGYGSGTMMTWNDKTSRKRGPKCSESLALSQPRGLPVKVQPELQG